MKSYTLISTVVVSARTIVEAESAEEAFQIARDRDVVMSVYEAGIKERRAWVVSDVDGDPTDIAMEVINTERKHA